MNETAYVDTPEMTVAKAAAARTLAWGSIGLIPVSFFSAMIAGNPVWAVGSMAALFALLAFFGARNNSVHGRILVGLGLIGQVICITAALSGHPWQLDSHMLFFAVLATLMIMSEPVVILAAAAVIAVHHLSLSIFLPALVYPSSDVFINLKRTIVHGVIVVVEAAVLWVSIRQRNNALWASAAAVKEAAEAADKTEEALEAARGAQSDMTRALTAAKEAEEVANAAREQAETETAKARETDKNARELEARERERTAATEAELSHVVGSLRQALGKLADGNVSEEISDDFPDAYADVKRDFNKTIDELNTVLTSLDRSSNTIVSDVATLEQAAASLSQRTEAQGATLEETAETVNQLADSSKQAAKSASEVNASVSNAKSIANASGKVVEDTVAAMAQIEQSSHQISTIIKMIDDIAFQTNLLALNAGVEAARAGDAGRGFSVVASEVRDLARRSSHAASEIGELVKQSGQNVAIGVEHVEHTGSALQEIIAAIDVISGHVSHIAESTEGQATSISDIHQAMKHLETMTQQNGAMFKETSSVTHSLSEQSKALEETMMRFSIKSDVTSDVKLTSQPKDLRPTQPVAISHSAANAALAIDETPRRTGWEEF